MEKRENLTTVAVVVVTVYIYGKVILTFLSSCPVW